MIGVEILDDPAADPALVRAELSDLVLLNRWFGGTRAVVAALEPWLRTGGTGTLLDVGTGSGDIPRAVVRAAARRGMTLTPIGVDRLRPVADVARRAGLRTVLADGEVLPFASKSVDFVIASQVLHHLPEDAQIRWIRELDRVARRAVVIADLHRTLPAMVAMWMVSFPMRLHPVTRHDAVLSLQRGYTKAELTAVLREAGVVTVVSRKPIARLVAVWRPARTLSAPGERLT